MPGYVLFCVCGRESVRITPSLGGDKARPKGLYFEPVVEAGEECDPFGTSGILSIRRMEVIPIELDLGDIVFSVTARVKNIVQPNKVVWRIGAPRKSTAAERIHRPSPLRNPTGKVDLYMDILDNEKVSLGIGWTDDAGNAADAPGAFTATYALDDATALNLTDNGDGTAEVTATGTLGSGTVHVDVDWTDASGAHNASGDMLVTVVADKASRVDITAGTPEHV